MLAFTVLVQLAFLESPAEEVLARASALLESGDAKGALRMLDALVTSGDLAGLGRSLQAQVLALHGEAAEGTDDPETAAASYSGALDASQGEAGTAPLENAILGLARSALKMKDGERARLALERLGAEARGREPARSLAATASFFEGRLREAETLLEACARDTKSAQTEYLLGVILFDRGDRPGALTRFESATRLDPADYYAEIYTARTLLELNRAEAALKALESLPATIDTPEVRYLMGKARLRLGQLLPASERFKAALELNPLYGEALFGLGTALRQAGKAEDARVVLKKFEEVHRTDAERLRKLDKMSQALLREPKSARLADELAQAHFESGDLEAAERYAWRALEHDPQRRSSRLVLARSFSRLGRFSAAAMQYQRILRSNPSDPDARRELSELVEKHARRKE